MTNIYKMVGNIMLTFRVVSDLVYKLLGVYISDDIAMYIVKRKLTDYDEQYARHINHS